MEYITKSTEETKSLGKKIATDLIVAGRNSQGARVLALVGDLGAGKTTFVQGLALGLGVDARIISPTFILMRNYGNLYHVDLYRLEKGVKREIENIGLTDIWGNPDNIVVIEWAEKIKNSLPKNTIWITFESIDENERKITVL